MIACELRIETSTLVLWFLTIPPSVHSNVAFETEEFKSSYCVNSIKYFKL
jgi:hypothetical protein